MSKTNNAIEAAVTPFNNFHKKSIIKDIPPLYLYKSKYDNVIYISYLDNGNCTIEIRDKDMHKIKNMQSRQLNENIIFIDETEDFLFCITENLKVYKYEKDKTYGLGMREEIDYGLNLLKMNDIYNNFFTSNDTYLILIINNNAFIINKITNKYFLYENIFNINDYTYLMVGPDKDEYVITKKSEKILIKPLHLNLDGIMEPLFIATTDNELIICCKHTNSYIDEKTFIRKLNYKYYAIVYKYNDNQETLEPYPYEIPEGYVPTCVEGFDKHAAFGLRNENISIEADQNKHLLLIVDIPNLLNNSANTEKENLKLDITRHKQYSTKFKNSNFVSVTRDNTYIYAGSENGDITIFNINDFYDTSSQYRIITKRNEDFVITQYEDYLSYIPGNTTELTYLGNSSFYINNACNGRLNFIYVDGYYLYAASKNNHDITVYIRDVKPSIVKDSDKIYTYVKDSSYMINYSATIDHDDKLIQSRYRFSLIINGKTTIIKDWSTYYYSRYKIKEKLEVNLKNLDYYNCKLLIEVEDINGVKVDSEYELDMLLDKECRLFSNKIIIPYKTIPDKDLTLKYSFYILNNDTLELIEHDEFNILSTHNTEWNVTIAEDKCKKLDADGNLIDIIIPHINTTPVNIHNFDYIEIYKPEITDNIKKKILYLTYTFEAKDENWSKRYPENDEYYIYDLSEFYKPKAIAKADGGISNIDKFNILDLSYGPGIETVQSLLFKGESGNKYEMTITNEGNIALNKVITSSENIVDNIKLCFRVNDNSKYDFGIKSPDGKIWDFDIISNSNGRHKHKYLVPYYVDNENTLRNLYGMKYKLRNDSSSEEKIITENVAKYLVGKTIYLYSSSSYTFTNGLERENLFLYKKDYDYDNIENIVKALSNPIKSSIIRDNELEKYKLTDKYDKYGEPTNNKNKIGYTMHPNGLAEETFKDHSHYFNVYIDGLKLPYKYIESDTDKRGEYSVKFEYDNTKETSFIIDSDKNKLINYDDTSYNNLVHKGNDKYKEGTVEIELMHSDNIDSENFIHRIKIQTEKDIENLYTGEYQVYIPKIQKSIDLKEFKLFVEYPLVNSTYRIDNCNYVIKRDSLNPSKLYIKLKNYILNNIGCNLVITTVDVDKQLSYYLENNGENSKPYYYLPLMKYDENGNLMYYYCDDIKAFDVVVNGYTLMPNIDYMLVNYYLHSHMPSFILFNEILKPDTNVEIIFNNEEVSNIISIPDNDTPKITVEDGYNMFIDGCFSIFVEGKKLRRDQYIILDRQNIYLLVSSYKRVYIKFQYKGYENLSSLVEILYAAKDKTKNSSELYYQITYNDYLSNIGIEDVKKEGKLYLIEAHSDRCFKDQNDAIFDCNIVDDKMFDVHIDCGINYDLSYINNDIIIDSNECYNRNDFTMTSIFTNDIMIEPERRNTPPEFTEQPSVKDINDDEIMVVFSIKDAESIFFDYKMSINEEEFKPIDKYNVAGNKVFVYISGLSTTRDHTVQFLVSDGELKTESDMIEINFNMNSAIKYPIFNQQPKLISSPNKLDAEFFIDAFEPNGYPMYLYIYINGREYNLGTFSTAVNGNKIKCDKFKSYGDYTVNFKLVNMFNTKIFKNSRELHIKLVKNENPILGNFVIDNINHNEKYIITHVPIADVDSDIRNMKVNVFLDNNKVYNNYEYLIVKDIAYVFVDNIAPGKHKIYLEIIDDYENIVKTETCSFELFDLFEPIEDIGYNKGIHNLELDKFGNIIFEYSVKDQNNMSLKHEISYNNFKFIEIDPIRYDDNYIFMGNIGTKLKEIKNLKVKVTNDVGSYIILEYHDTILLPLNEHIKFNGKPYITSLSANRIEIEYSPINYDNDLLYLYYS